MNGGTLLLGSVGLTVVAAACGGEPESESRPESLALVAELLDRHPAVIAAVETARTELTTGGHDAARWGRLGMVYHANAMFELACECYAEASILDPEPARWLYLGARARRDLGQDERALALAMRALEADGDVAGAYWLIGQHHLDAADLDAARAAFEQAARLAPHAPGGWSGQARVSLLEDDPTTALVALERALSKVPGDAYAHNLMALAFRQQGRLDEAQTHQALGAGGVPDWEGAWDQALRAERVRTGMLRWEVASELFDAGRLEEAITLLEGVRREEPQNRGLATFLAQAYARAGRLRDAQRLYRETLAAEPENRDALVGLASIFGRLDQLESARETIERALVLHPSYGRAHHVHGVLLKRLDEPALAIDAFKRSLFHDQRNPSTRLSIGLLELDLRRWSDARDTLTEALAAGSTGGPLWLSLAKAQLMLRDVDAAGKSLEQAAAAPAVDQRALGRLQVDWRRAGGEGGA